MLKAFSRQERHLLVALLAALLLAGALLAWQQGQSRKARRQLLAEQPAGLIEVTGEAYEGEEEGKGQDGAAGPSPKEEQGEAAPDLAGEVPADQGEPLLVHVAGAVTRPGVYALPAGARAIDGLEAAGGPTPQADVEQINLAAPVADGQRLYIPRQGEQLDPDPGEAVSAGTAGLAAEAPADPPKINLNKADETALQAVPGIGPVLARRIVTYRAERGSFRRVQDLTQVAGIGPRSVEKMLPYLFVDD